MTLKCLQADTGGDEEDENEDGLQGTGPQSLIPPTGVPSQPRPSAEVLQWTQQLAI